VQYTTAPASSVLVATNPVASSAAANAIESFIDASSIRPLKRFLLAIGLLTQVKKRQPDLSAYCRSSSQSRDNPFALVSLPRDKALAARL
jgi:hypothetical protein